MASADPIGITALDEAQYTALIDTHPQWRARPDGPGAVLHVDRHGRRRALRQERQGMLPTRFWRYELAEDRSDAGL